MQILLTSADDKILSPINSAIIHANCICMKCQTLFSGTINMPSQSTKGKHLACWVKGSADDILKYCFYFSQKIGILNISYKMSSYFLGKNKKNLVNLSSANRVVGVNLCKLSFWLRL